MQSKYKIMVLFIFSIVVSTVCYYVVSSYLLKPKLTLLEEAHVNELLSKMKTHCVGRYLIDLPASFTLTTGKEPLEKDRWIADISWPERSFKTYITSKRMYYPAFELMLKRLEQEMRETRTDNPENMPFLKKIWPLPVDMKGVIFERNLDSNSNDSIRTLEAYIYSNGVAIKLQKESVNDLSPRYQKDRERRGSETNYIPGDLERLRELILRVRGRDEDEIPLETGSCIANGFISADTSDNEQEDMSFVFSTEKLSGVKLIVSTNNFLQAQDGLLDRVGEITRGIIGEDVNIIRKGRREINDMKAEELLMTGIESDSELPFYVFNFYVNERSGSNKSPWFNITLMNDLSSNDTAIEYSRDELTELWSVITQTVRMRPIME